MAKVEFEIPNEIFKDFKFINDNYEQIFKEMTRKGAEVVYSNVTKNAPASLKNSSIMRNLKLSRTYKTPSDDGINTKVLFSGYFNNKIKNKKGEIVGSKKTPAPLVVNLFEYGNSDGTYPKKPFFRKSFNKSQIENAMKKAQKELSGGLLDE